MKKVDEASVGRIVEVAWREVFEQELDDDQVAPAPLPGFFELGGSSLTAMMLAMRLGDELGLEVSPADIMTFPFASELARAIWQQLDTFNRT